jgi:MYXO-CTERM domain-containing protein
MRLVALCVVGGLVMLAAARAHADWRTDVSVKERPNDVLEVWEPGNFSLGYVGGTRPGAYLFLDGGLSRDMASSTTADPAGTYYQRLPDDCFIMVNREEGGPRFGRREDGLSCGSFIPGEMIVPNGGQPVLRVKHAADGGAVALALLNDDEYAVYLSGTGIYNGTGFNPVQDNSGRLRALNGPVGVVRVGSSVYALLGTAVDSSPISVYWVDSNALTWVESQTPNGSLPGTVQAINLFSAGSPAYPYAVVGTQQGLMQGSILASGNPIKPVQEFDAGVGVGVLSVSMNVGAGSDAGQGFGMAIVSRPDGSDLAVMSPVPMPDDTQAGTVWRPRALPESVASAPLKQVACTGASYCVFTADQADGGNLFIYTNGAGPEISMDAGGASVVGDSAEATVVFDEKKLPAMLTFAAEDPDGDPVLVTVSPPSVSTVPGWEVVDGGRPGDPVVVNITGGTICKSQDAGVLWVSASDGLGRHDAHKKVQVRVNHTRPPELPTVVFSDGGTVPSSGRVGELLPGGPPLSLRAVGGDTTAAGCKIQKQWKPLFSGTGGPSLEQDGGTAVLTPPDSFCTPDAGSFDVQFLVTDEGAQSNSRVFTVRVAPWGRPNAVFGADSGEELTAGNSRLIEPTQSPHVCQGGNPPYPGVDTEWTVTLPDGSAPGGGITFRDGVDGGLSQGFPLWAEKLRVETPDCIDTDLVVTAVHHLRTAEAFPGPSSRHHVRVRTELTAFDGGAFQLDVDGGPEPSDELWVNVDSTLNCPTRRGLRADLWLERVDGGERMQPATVSIPGTWRPSLKEGCGRPLRVKGMMVDDEHTDSTVFEKVVSTPPREVGLEALPETALVARCGEKASLSLTQTFPPEACQMPDVTWTQEAGPLLEKDSLSGRTVSLVTRDTELDSLVGRSVVMRVTASVGLEKEATRLHTLPITVEPFVEVRRRAEMPAASETEFVGISVELLNTTACGVRDVSYVERLEGLTYVEGSAKWDGQPVNATWEEGALTVTGLALAGGGTGKLTYVARPHMVGERRMRGEARLRDIPISLRDDPGPPVPDSGCGCSGSGPGPVLFALGALVAAVRRRRR